MSVVDDRRYVPATPLDLASAASRTEWSAWFDVTEDVLAHAVSRVGVMPAALAFYLQKHKPRQRSRTPEERAALDVRKIAQAAGERTSRRKPAA